MDSGLGLHAVLYAVALVAAVLVLTRVPSRLGRQAMLLGVSYLLYISWGYWFAGVLLISTLGNFFLGRWLRRNPGAGALWIGLTFNLVLLAVFKYLPGAAASLPLASLRKFDDILLPLGISFWTFQAMSYLLDLYRGEELDPTPIEFALYMAFFPVVISGPICRLPEMLSQFRSHQSPSRDDIGRGVCRIATGVLMMQVSQLLGKGIFSGLGINAGFDPRTAWAGPDVWCLTVGYGLQIFFDFAGYSHMAIGAARVMGFTVPENFARPFASTTPSVFWTRWHISLSFWIRDYVFLPLAVLRREQWWRKFCLLIAMVLFGIWHKGTWLFVLFGCYHGVLLIVHRQVQEVERRFNWEPPAKLWPILSWIATMALVNLAWIFFRANSLAEARQMFSAVLSPATYGTHVLSSSLYFLVALVAAAYWVTLYVIEVLDRCAERMREAAAPPSEFLALLLRERWIWLAPLWALVCALVLAALPHQSRAANVFLYRNF
jgi:alginate O-acetyltransferase complex protein AlgI